MLTGHVQADFAQKVVRLEAVVIPDGELEGLTNELLAGEVHKHERLVPLRLTRALDVPRPPLVVRTTHKISKYGI